MEPALDAEAWLADDSDEDEEAGTAFTPDNITS